MPTFPIWSKPVVSETQDATAARTVPESIRTPSRSRARWARHDFGLFAYIPAATLVAWCCPERYWTKISGAIARFLMGLRQENAGQHYHRLKGLLGSRASALDVREILVCYAAKKLLARVQGMRCHAPGGWSPRIRLEGREHLDRALAAGKGAILWVAPMASRDLITKIAMHRAGYAVSHLSRFDHGFSISYWGARLFNPIWTKIEDRYVAERLVISPANRINPLRTMIQRLRENRVVSISATVEGSKNPCVAPFFEGFIKLSEGAPSLAVTTGAVLLPVFTVGEPDGSFTTTIEPPLLPIAGDASLRIGSLVSQYARLIETYVLRFPCDYQGWYLSEV